VKERSVKNWHHSHLYQLYITNQIKAFDWHKTLETTKRRKRSN